jgi:thiamine-phosphate pyrophosphorylase
MRDFSLYLVTDRELCGSKSLEQVVLAAIRGGVSIVQLREKEISTREFVALARHFKKLLEPWKVPLIINDRLDVALASNADGIHIGQSDLEYSDARRFLGADKIIGVSASTPAEAEIYKNESPTYIAASTIFLTSTKHDATFALGLEGLRRLKKTAIVPVIAIGGIKKANLSDVLSAGADGVAVVSVICADDDPERATRELREAIDLHRTFK